MTYEEMKRRIEERARELWEADGRPRGAIWSTGSRPRRSWPRTR